MVSIKQINYALAVEKEMHFKNAADKCFVSASTLSNAISEMEKQLGFEIFERNNKKVIVTKLGEEILKKYKSIKIQLEDIQKISENNSQPLSHPISLGVIPTISPFLMPHAVKSLSTKFPKLNLKISESQSNDLIDKVKNGDLDMAILALPFKLQGLIPIKFWAEDFFWITKKNDARSKDNVIKANELDRSELLLLEEGHCLKDHILSACKMTKQASNISFKASSLNTLIQFVKSGMGTTLVPRMAISQLMAGNPDLKNLHLDESGPHREIAIVIRPNYGGIQDVELLGAELKKILQENSS
jgi:LysR family hydrogen peroxide-inducible transcriptional activator